jgi:hypothetical protein
LGSSLNQQRLVNDFNYLATNYFSHPSYLEINGKKVVFFDASRFFVGDVDTSLSQIRASVKPYQLYLICDALGNYLPPNNENMIKLIKAFDAISADDMWANNYGDLLARSDFVSYTEKTLELWGSIITTYNRDMIPSINPGWEPYLYLKLYPSFDAPFLERNNERYERLLSIATRISKNLIVGHFNEFFTHNHIEPDTKDGFTYLEVLKRILIQTFR